MLPFHGRWRNASKRAPEREARLLMFANFSLPGDDDFKMPGPGDLPDPTDAEMLRMTPDEVRKCKLHLKYTHHDSTQ